MEQFVISIKFNAADEGAAIQMGEDLANKMRRLMDESSTTTGYTGLYSNAQIALTKVVHPTQEAQNKAKAELLDFVNAQDADE